MSNVYTLTLKHPYEALGLPIPIGRKLQEIGKGSWLVLMVCATIVCAAVYIFQISQTATKGYALRTYELERDRLSEQVSVLEGQIAEQQSMRALQERVAGLGYVPVQRLEFLDVNGKTYALAK